MFFGKPPQGDVIGSPQELDKRALHPIFDLRWAKLPPSIQAAFINLIVNYAKRFVVFTPVVYSGNYAAYRDPYVPSASATVTLT